MHTVTGLVAVFRDHPWVALAVFVIVLAILVRLIGGASTRLALYGMRKAVASFFTAPFAFLKDMMMKFARIDEFEAAYRNSHEHLAYVANRFNGLAVVVTAVLVLAGGLSSALVALYPGEEIERQRPLREALESTRKELEKDRKTLETVGKPDFVERLKTDTEEKHKLAAKAGESLEKARNAVESAAQDLNVAGAISSILSTSSEESARTVATRIVERIDADCGGWSGFPTASCPVIRQKFVALGEAHAAALAAKAAAAESARAVRDVDSDKSRLEARVAETAENLKRAQAAYDAVDLWKLRWLGNRLLVAGGILLATAAWVVAVVWCGALVVQALGWIILMMLSLERKNAPK